MTPARSSWRHYLGWAGVSQGVNAGTNVLLTLLLARSLAIRDFGTVAIGLAFIPLAVGWLRGMSYEPAVVHGDLSRPAAARVLADSLVAGLGAGACLLLMVTSLGGPVGIAGMLLVGAAGTAVEEGARWVLFGLDKPRRGAALDLVWAAVQLAPLAISTRSATLAAAGWAAGAVASAGAGCIAVHRSTERRPGAVPTRAWHWGLEYVVGAAALQLAVLAAPITGGVEVSAGLRGAMSLLGAASVLLGGAQQAVAGRLRWVEDNASLRRWGVRLGIALGVLVCLVSLPLLAVGGSLGRQLLGDTWPATRSVLPILILQKTATATTCGPAFVLRRQLEHRSGLTWRVIVTAVTLALVMVGAKIGSAEGAAWALALGAVVSVPIWMSLLTTATRSPEAGPRASHAIGISADEALAPPAADTIEGV